MLRKVRKSLSIYAMLALACAGAQAQNRLANGGWDLSADFSATNNPNGAWSYGWTESDGSRFTLGTWYNSLGPDAWGGFRGSDGTPFVSHNGTDTTIWYTPVLFWEPGETIFHPGPGDERAVVRWTAPSEGAFAVQSRFYSKDTGPTDVSVLLNGTPVSAANLDYDWSASRYQNRLVLAAGDTVDFTVGSGTDSSAGADSTGIAVTVARADCGNGRLDAGEECDDGNTNPSDGCTNACTVCGNHMVAPYEQCDDGNLVNGDGCDSNCTRPACGNGVRTAGEQCDDGNGNDSDGCTNACTVCGNGVVTPPEECDDGNLVDGDCCSSRCRLPVGILAGPVVNPANKHRYYLLAQAPWPASEAQAVCLGGHLAAINNEAEQTWVWEQFSQFGGVGRDLWIGLNDAATEGTFVWTSGEPLIYTHWGDWAPDNVTDGEDYVHMFQWVPDGVWDDYAGDSSERYGISLHGVVELTDCGNGVPQSDQGEECDDGNADPADGCTNWCTICGNGVVSPYEQCDDGNLTDHDGCNSDCQLPICGDRIVDPGEQCDDGNSDDFDGCTNSCTRCGNRVVTRPEECDDGNTSNSDACRNDCRFNVCGDGFRNPATEQCDDGNTASEDGCSAACRTEYCGDRVWQTGLGEQCDDGNAINGDGCEADCTLPWCRNGIVDGGEECDDGNWDDSDGCTNACTRCGNGVVTAPETCDDGNRDTNDFCRNDCHPNVCGDGVANPPTEQCDDGNRNPSDGCTNDCTICGNGIVTPPERCDDGNRVDGDACDAACRLAEAVVGTGTPQSCTEAALDAALAGGRAVTFNCGAEPVTITITSTKTIAADTTIDGGGSITISGGDAVGVFAVNAGITFDARNLTVADGAASQGGGIANYGTATLANCTLSGNSANEGGGGIYNLGNATLTNCTLSGNSAGYYGGGAIFNAVTGPDGGPPSNSGTATLTNCTLSGNSAGQGGGIANLGNATLTNCTLSGNSATYRGGGIYHACYCWPVGLGMSACACGSVTLTNTIIAGSAGGSCSQQEGMPGGGSEGVGSIVDGGHNLQFPGTSCGDTIPSLDPLLDPAGLADNGGPTQTIALLPGSPAIDAGDNASCPATDQRGVPRPFGAACDIGAYERAACGNGQADPGEQCDDGNLNPGDGCTNACTICGNGVITSPEECDDGNRVNGDDCEADCTVPRCGNGILDRGEQCDDGNLIDGDGCDVNCRREFCGDAIVQTGLGEQCDDGNLVDGDGCDVNCTLHHVVGNGTRESCTEAALDQALGGGGLVSFNCGSAPVTITVTSTKYVGGNGRADTVDGGGRITLSGGNAVQVFGTGGVVRLKNLTIANGFGGDDLYSWYGGGITNYGSLTVTRCTFVGNRAVGFGGGILNQYGGTLTVVNSTFSGNTAPHGGGISSIRGGTATVINSTFSGNSGTYGGGIDCEGNSETVLRNTIVANNSGGQCNDGIIIDGGHNLQWPGTDCGATIRSRDPLLDPDGLQDNGGSTETIALLAGSPAINAGDPEVCANPPVNRVDQRGYVRPGTGSANCSIGAYEHDSPGPPTVSCAGDCSGDAAVTIEELITLVNIALGNAQPSACLHGVPSGAEVNVALIIQAVNVALNGCGGG
jgi:cysteine-rich repeat protein